MSITEISVKRPAAITIVMALLIGLGIIGYMSMGADLLPSMNIPVITVTDTYVGAGAEEIKEDVIKPIEDAVSGISGIDTITSSARENYGQVTLQFTSETDMNTALMDVQKAMEGVKSSLPDDAGEPVLFKLDIAQMMGSLYLSVNGDVPYDQLYNEAEKIKESLEKVNGIGKVSLMGGKEKQLSIRIDKTALEYYGVNINTVIMKLKSGNINIPAGNVEDAQSSQTVKVIGQYENVDEIRNIFIPTLNGGNVRLSDVADVKFEYPKDNAILRVDGKDTIVLSVQKQSDANIVKAVDAAKKEITNIQKTLPKGVKLEIAMDTTTFITSSLKGIEKNLLEGIITTALVLMLFLKSWRSSLIVLVSIPTSLVSTFFAMYLSGFTMNMLSMMGLSLCIGILVDDSIVILENIQRHLDKGQNKVDSAINGRKEIGLAAIAITLCDIVVFLPVAFISGMAGQMFKQFGLTVAFASLFSLFISFTITPMLASKFAKKSKNFRDEDMSFEDQIKSKTKLTPFDKMLIGYRNMLNWCLGHKKRVIAIITAAVILSIALIPMGLINFEYMATADQSMFNITMQLTPGSNLSVIDKKIKTVEDHLKGIPEIKTFFSSAGYEGSTSSVVVEVVLKNKNQRKKSQTQIANEVREWAKRELYGVEFNIIESQMGGSGSAKPISIEVKGTNMDVLEEIAAKVEQTAKQIPELIDVSNSVSTRNTEIKLKVDRLAAEAHGITPGEVASVLRTAMEGTNAGVFRQNGDEYDIVVAFEDKEIKTLQDIGAFPIFNSAGQKVLVSQIAKIEKGDSAQTISRKDRRDVVTISANIKDGAVLSVVSNKLIQKIKDINTPGGYEINFGGTQEDMIESFTSLLKALGASLVLIYMILVILYESFLTPLIRMLALPCAVIGALGIFALTGKPIDMMSMIGLIMLDGLASKNGTLLIDYTNTLIKKGLSLKEALLEAGTTRLRPIIMTSATMIVGMLPTAFSMSEGSETKVGMALIIIGGMVTSTVLTPILIPVVYSLMDDWKHIFIKKKNKRALEVSNYEM